MAWSAERQSAYMKEYYAANRDRLLQAMRERHCANRDASLKKMREYHRKNREEQARLKRERRKQNPQYFNDQKRWSKYKLTPEQFQSMLTAQGRKCAICGDERKLVVDHCHDTGAVRSLLCSPCNTAIGLLKEDTARLRAAIKYLSKHARAVAAKSGALDQNQGAV